MKDIEQAQAARDEARGGVLEVVGDESSTGYALLRALAWVALLCGVCQGETTTAAALDRLCGRPDLAPIVTAAAHRAFEEWRSLQWGANRIGMG